MLKYTHTNSTFDKISIIFISFFWLKFDQSGEVSETVNYQDTTLVWDKDI